jgi:hypothetical protein
VVRLFNIKEVNPSLIQNLFDFSQRKLAREIASGFFKEKFLMFFIGFIDSTWLPETGKKFSAGCLPRVPQGGSHYRYGA